MEGSPYVVHRSPLRRLASAIVPASSKRRIDELRNRRTMSIIAPANREFVRRHGLEVTQGPFMGMKYLPGLEARSGDLITKLIGRYEAELQPALAAWPAADLKLVVNVGCAEGYYAVGLARMLPEARILAYDIDPLARRQCAELAVINGVEDRVTVESECTPEILAGLPPANVAILCDCEGCEKHLLDPDRAPTLRGWSMIVELHDFVDPAITNTICERFTASHEIELIPSAAPVETPELAFLTARQRAEVLKERPVPMRWASLRPSREARSPEAGPRGAASLPTA
jgi:hypothetical protein